MNKLKNWFKEHKRLAGILIVIPAIALMADSCDGQPAANVDVSAQVQQGASQGTQRYEQLITEQNQQTLDKNQKVPTLTQSNERANLIKRLTTFNDPNKVSYIYLISYGKVMAFYDIKGKVSSVNSMLTTNQQLVDANGQPCSGNDVYQGALACTAVNSPDLDGSYGSNGNAIFFFDTGGVYHEWSGDYLMVDQPQQLSTPPEIVQTIPGK